MSTKRRSLSGDLAASLGAIVLAFILAAPAAAAGPGECDDAKASSLVGAPAPSDTQAREATGAGAIRRIRPGAPVTLDFSASRLTLEIEHGKVVAARCG